MLPDWKTSSAEEYPVNNIAKPIPIAKAVGGVCVNTPFLKINYPCYDDRGNLLVSIRRNTHCTL